MRNQCHFGPDLLTLCGTLTESGAIAGVEIACNLLCEDETPVAAVIERVQQLALDERVRVCEGPLGSEPGMGPYVLGLTREGLVQTAREHLTRRTAG